MKKSRVVTELGRELELWRHKTCIAIIALGDDWATLYLIHSGARRRGHATQLLARAKAHYEAQGKTFGGAVALNDDMRRIYQRLNIKEYL